LFQNVNARDQIGTQKKSERLFEKGALRHKKFLADLLQLEIKN